MHIGQGSQKAPLDGGVLPLQVHQKLLHPFALLIRLTADRAPAAYHRKLVDAGKLSDFLFFHVDKRSDDGCGTVVGQHSGRHGFERADKELVQQQGLDEVVHVVAERQLVAAEPLGEAVEHPPLEPGADGTVGGVGAPLLLDDLVVIGFLQMMGEAMERRR